MHLETNSRRWQNSPRRSVSRRWLASAYSVLTRSEEFRFQERHKRPAWAYEPWNDGSLSIGPMGWLDSFGGPAKIADAESCRKKRSS
jgi:hypothetical protein